MLPPGEAISGYTRVLDEGVAVLLERLEAPLLVRGKRTKGEKGKGRLRFQRAFRDRGSRIAGCGLRIDLLTLVPNQLLAGWKARPTLSLFAISPFRPFP
jgi:intein/homing endonuclease